MLLSSSTRGQGDAGNVIIQADSISFDGVSNGFASGALSTVEPAGKGQGGNVIINTGSLSLTNGGRLISSTFGQGNAGGVNVQASGRVFLDGVSNDGFVSGIFSTVEAGVTGNAGNISVSADSLSVNNGAALSSSTRGQGDAGNVRITVGGTASFDGFSPDGRFSSGAFSTVEQSAVGKGGNVDVTIGTLSLTNGAALSSSTSGKGDAGNISVQASGSIFLNNSSNISSLVRQGGLGDGGNISVQTPTLTLKEGSQFQSGFFRPSGNLPGGNGKKGGNISVKATDFVELSGYGTDGLSSGLLSLSEQGTLGQSGDITVSTNSLRVTNGAIISASTFNPSNGGNIFINANSLEAITGGQVTTTSQAEGNAGNITIIVKDGVMISGSDATFAERNARNADIGGTGNQGANSGLFASTDMNSSGNGGNIFLSATRLNLNAGGQVSAQSQSTGSAGNIIIRASGTFQANDGKITTTAQSTGGVIDIAAKNIRLQGNSDITTNVANGNGGNITLTAKTIVALGDSDILAFAQQGRGGNITLNTRAFFGQDYRPGSPPPWDGNGRVDINASGTVAGVITLPDTSFIQNGLTSFSQVLVDSSTLLANSCIVRRNRETGSTFFITGSGGLPYRPGDLPLAAFPMGEVRNVAADAVTDFGVSAQSNDGTDKRSSSSASSASNPLPDRPWKIGDPIVEPQGVYQLPNGELVMSRECP